MIVFIRRVLPLLDRSTRRKLVVATVLLIALAAFESLALLAIAPLLQILTSPGFHPNSRLVTTISKLLGEHRPLRLAETLGLIAVGIYVVKDVAGIVINRWAAKVCFVGEALLVRRLMHLYLHGPYREHVRVNSSEFVRTLTDAVRVIFGSAIVATYTAIADLCAAVFVVAILVAADPVVAVVACAYLVAIGLIYQRTLHAVVTGAAKELHDQQATDFRLVHQSLTAIKEVKVSGKEDYFRDEVYALRSGLAPYYRTMALLSIVPRYVLELAMVGGTVALAAAAYSLEPVPAATATLGLFLAGSFRLLSPLNKVMFGVNQARRAFPSMDQIERDEARFAAESNEGSKATTSVLFDGADRRSGSPQAPPVRSEVPPLSSGRPGSGLEVRKVSFSYEVGRPVLRDVSFAVGWGDSVGLVGPTGSGKSTLLDLLLGLLQPDEGEIYVDGGRLGDQIGLWRERIGFVPQTISLFDDTISANVALGTAPDAVDEQRVWEVLEIAQLAGVVAALPAGIRTTVGERGVRLSGGQRQRLGVARALYSGPSVLMFDEATSALDNQTEFKLTEVLETLQGKLTALTIAHRLSTIRNCDRVLYLSEGALIAEGSFDDVLREVPDFADQVRLSQARGA